MRTYFARMDWAAFYTEPYGDSDTTDSIPHHLERLVEMVECLKWVLHEIRWIMRAVAGSIRKLRIERLFTGAICVKKSNQDHSPLLELYLKQ